MFRSKPKASRRMMSFRLVFIIFVLLFCNGKAANPISIPIIRNAMNVNTRLIAQLPREDGSPASIICIIPFPTGRDMAVCTLKNIYRVRQNGRVSLFLNVDRAFATNGRRLNYDNRAHGGVRSIAFHPQFSTNRLFYISAMEDRPRNPRAFRYISDARNPIAADSVLVEFRVNRLNRAVESSYRLVFRVGMPVFDHPIKQIAFRGRFLYIAHGDGSVQSAIAGGGQGNDALGKILRINPRRRGSRPYTVPRSNPFVRRRNMRDEIWALGFRNPHHLCFSRRGTLFVADAGRDNIEEINIVQSGKNYGWSSREGTFVHRQNDAGGLINGIRDLPRDDARNGFEYPVAQVGHEGNVGDGFVGQAIAGACPVENGSPMSGNYFYADFPVSGRLFFSRLNELSRAVTNGNPNRLTQARTRQANIIFEGVRYGTLGEIIRADPQFASQTRADVRFGRGNRGELYWSSKRNGRLYVFTSSLPR